MNGAVSVGAVSIDRMEKDPGRGRAGVAIDSVSLVGP